MSTSVDRKSLFRRSRIYLAISAFLVVFDLVYGLFAHGVDSPYMRFAFLVPFVGGTVVSLLLIALPQPGAIVRNLWRAGLATLAVGFLLHGVFDIYGSRAPLVTVYFVAGIGLLGIGIVLYIALVVYAHRKAAAASAVETSSHNRQDKP